METVQGGVPPYGVKETLVVNGNNRVATTHDSNAILFVPSSENTVRCIAV